MRAQTAEEIDEVLKDLEVYLNRLRIDYELYFAGSAKREPAILRGKVQKLITRMVNEPPRNSAQKFRFNTLNSRFQCFRQHWGRIQREMDAGTYKPHKFKADMRVGKLAESGEGLPDAAPETPKAKRTAIDQLHDALKSARKKTGENIADLSKEKLAAAVRKQTEALKAKHGDATKVRFRVVIENGKAKLKAAAKGA